MTGTRIMLDFKDFPAAVVGADLLRLEEAGPDHFRSLYNQPNQVGTMFGGQMLAQGLAAAHRTVQGWSPHSLSAYFHRAGTMDQPLEFKVERVRDGSRFAARRVVASQGGRTLLDMLCSFQAQSDGIDHQFATLGAVPKPEDLVTEQEFLAAHPDILPADIAALYALPFPVEIKPVAPEQRFSGKLDSPFLESWIRYGAVGDVAEAAQHAMLIAFLSDFRLAQAVSAHHVNPSGTNEMLITSLAHNIVFHHAARADEWLFHRMESPWAGGGRGLARGQLFDQRHRLIASTVQEVLVRSR